MPGQERVGYQQITQDDIHKTVSTLSCSQHSRSFCSHPRLAQAVTAVCSTTNNRQTPAGATAAGALQKPTTEACDRTDGMVHACLGSSTHNGLQHFCVMQQAVLCCQSAIPTVALARSQPLSLRVHATSLRVPELPAESHALAQKLGSTRTHTTSINTPMLSTTCDKQLQLQ